MSCYLWLHVIGFGFVTWFGTSLSCPGKKGNLVHEDKALVARVTLAVLLGVAPSDVEKVVGEKATRNTLRQEDKIAIQGVRIGPIDRVPWFAECEIVMYWVRPTNTKNPQIIGITWKKKESGKVFFGEGYRP